MIILLILGYLKKEFKNMKFEVQQTHIKIMSAGRRELKLIYS